jgi:hypothetical protein
LAAGVSDVFCNFNVVENQKKKRQLLPTTSKARLKNKHRFGILEGKKDFSFCKFISTQIIFDQF